MWFWCICFERWIKHTGMCLSSLSTSTLFCTKQWCLHFGVNIMCNLRQTLTMHIWRQYSASWKYFLNIKPWKPSSVLNLHLTILSCMLKSTAGACRDHIHVCRELEGTNTGDVCFRITYHNVSLSHKFVFFISEWEWWEFIARASFSNV